MFDIAAVLILRGFSKKGYTSLFLRQIGAHLKNVWTIYNKHMMISHCFPFWRKNTGEYPPVSIQLNKCPFLAVEITAFGECVCVCVCVCFLPIHSRHQVRWTYQPGSHRRKVTQDFSSTFFLRCVP